MAGEWQSSPFERLLAEPVRNGVYKPKAFHGRGAKIVNMGELFAHPRLRAVPMKRVELSGSESERFTLSKGDLLFARRSLVAEGAGKCSVVLDINEPTTFESSIIRARPDNAKAEPLFLYYFFNSTAGLHFLDTIRRQVAVAGITGSDLSRLEIPVPPLLEQRAIAHILGTLDDKIELNRRMNETLETMARALFKSWFVDFDPVRAKAEGCDPGLPQPLADLFPDRFVDSELGEIPEGWEMAVVGDRVRCIKGKSYKREHLQDGDTALVTLKSFARGGGYRSDGLKGYAGDFKGEQVVRAGELVVACTDVTQAAEVVGKPALVRSSDEFATLVASLDVVVVRPRNDSVSVPFLYCLFRTDQFSDHTYAHSTGTTVLHLSKDAVPSYRFVLPTKNVANAFECIAELLFKRLDENERESRTLAVLRDTLLPKLISGELRVKDAERFVGEVV
ncbi:MAG: restriction endonuclease subunit S [Gammaproteobacteria bacterium]